MNNSDSSLMLNNTAYIVILKALIIPKFKLLVQIKNSNMLITYKDAVNRANRYIYNENKRSRTFRIRPR